MLVIRCRTEILFHLAYSKLFIRVDLPLLSKLFLQENARFKNVVGVKESKIYPETMSSVID